jgi:anti-sigma28 factor (negative regulator of flagellin synthesis)
MTSIDPIGSASSTSVSSYYSSIYANMYRVPQAMRTSAQDSMASVSNLLGVSASDLRTRLQSGQSLSTVAESQGVAHGDLINAIKDGIRSGSTFEVDTDSLAEQIAGNTRTSAGPPQGQPPGGPRGENSGLRDESKLTKLSGMLDMSTDDVASNATSATKLVELLQRGGVDLGQLKNVLSSGDLLDVHA